MPDLSDKRALLKWVEETPGREKIDGYDALLQHCATRYSNTSRDLEVVMRELLERFHSHLRRAMLQNLNDPAQMGEAADRAFKSAVLRMWVYASEYSRRWDVPALLDGFQTELAQLVAPPKED